jgi:hypothetical protein
MFFGFVRGIANASRNRARMTSLAPAVGAAISLYSLAGINLGPDEQEQLQKAENDLQWMRQKRVWGPLPGETAEGRYLWTEAFGSAFMSSLYAATGNEKYLRENEALIEDVMKVLGPDDTKGRKLLAISGDKDEEDEKAICSYAHYDSIWMHALHIMSKVHPNASKAQSYHDLAVDLAKDMHPRFVARDRKGNAVGIYWKMYTGEGGRAIKPQPGKGLGGLDHYDLYGLYRQLDPERKVLAKEIEELEPLVMEGVESFSCSQDLGLGMMLHACHPFIKEAWAQKLANTCLGTLDGMFVKAKGKEGEAAGDSGYFCRAPWAKKTCVAFASAGAGIGVQAFLPQLGDKWQNRVKALRRYLEIHWKDDDEYAFRSITWNMMCCNRFPGLLIKKNLDAVAKVVAEQQQKEQQGMAAGGAKAGGASSLGSVGQPQQPVAGAGAGHLE